MIGARWEDGAAVRLIRNLRNDGTYPGLPTGAPLVRRGTLGHVADVGLFLQDQIIYSVHFLEAGRIVGCREEELIDADAPWTPPRFEFRDRVRALTPLAIGGEILVAADAPGEVIRVLCETPAEAAEVVYHVHFDALPGRPLRVPETALRAADPLE